MTRPAPLPELGFYGLPGHTDSPRDLLDECNRAEEIGLGACFISERFNVKEAASLTGAACAVTDRLGIATSVTNHNTRHPTRDRGMGRRRCTAFRAAGSRSASAAASILCSPRSAYSRSR